MNITATVQARMGSSRLPGKVLKPIAGKPMLQHQIERIRRSRLIDDIVIATTTSPKDDPIVDLAHKLNVNVFRGSEDDVLCRITSLLKEYSVDIHAELIGDSPFSDPQIIDEIIGFYLKNQDKYDYVSNGSKVTYPSGMEVNVYPASVLIKADSMVSTYDPLREHVDIHISKNKEFRSFCLDAPPYFYNPDIYLEVDTEKDFQMVSAIFEYFAHIGKEHFSLSQILDFLSDKPELIKHNQNEERRWKVFKE